MSDVCSADLLEPVYPWELVQIGNCGSPIELDEGWLLLTHGVGAMRKYSIGAVLLDKEDPSKVIAQSREPILTAADESREGYVPNVFQTRPEERSLGKESGSTYKSWRS